MQVEGETFSSCHSCVSSSVTLSNRVSSSQIFLRTMRQVVLHNNFHREHYHVLFVQVFFFFFCINCAAYIVFDQISSYLCEQIGRSLMLKETQQLVASRPTSFFFLFCFFVIHTCMRVHIQFFFVCQVSHVGAFQM